MAATERPIFRMGHLTVVPTNFDPRDVDALEERADRTPGADATGGPATGERTDRSPGADR